MTFQQFQKASDEQLRQEVIERFDHYNETRPGGVEWLWEAQFFMGEIDRREGSRVSKRDVRLELIIIFLILMEILIGVWGIVVATRDSSAQATVMQKLVESSQVTAATLKTLQGTTAQMNKAIQRQLNDRHMDLLRPVLRSESSQLKGTSDQIKAQGHISPMRKGEPKDSSSSRLWPDVMSRDLENHFPEYDRAKHKLQSEIDAQDQEFYSVLSSLQAQIKPESDLTPDWKEIAALSFVEKCLGHEEGIKLRVFDSGYSFESLGGTSSGSGGGPNPPRPSPDQVAAFRAYESLKLDAPLSSHCGNLKRRAEGIIHASEDLSTQALRLSASVVLQGTCQFIKNVN